MSQPITTSNVYNPRPDLESIKDYVIKTEGENSKWARIVCVWNEKKVDNTTVKHIFTPLVNVETGDIYLDCSKKKIYVKFITHTLLRPIHLIFKTVYHMAMPISIPHIIYNTISEEIEKGDKTVGEIALECLKKSFNSVVDIGRTPMYLIAMTVVNIAALIIGPLAPQTLYRFREMTGHLVQALHREDTVVPDFFACFQPIEHLSEVRDRDYEKDDTVYSEPKTDNSKGLNNFARGRVRILRKHYEICSNPFGKLDHNVTFISPSYGSVLEKNPNFSSVIDGFFEPKIQKPAKVEEPKVEEAKVEEAKEKKKDKKARTKGNKTTPAGQVNKKHKSKRVKVK